MTLQVAALLAGLALTFGVATQALAYEEIEIEYETSNGKTIVDVSYELDGIQKDSKFNYSTTDLDEVWEKLSDDLDLTVEDIEAILDGTYFDEDNGSREDAEEAIEDAEFALEEAVYEIEDEDDVDERAELQEYYDTAEEYLEEADEAFNYGEYADAEEWAEKAEDKVREYILGESSDEDKEDAEEAIEDAEEAIEDAELYIESLENDDKDLEEYLEIAKDYLQEAELAFEDGEYADAEEWAEKAEDKVEVYILDDKDDNKGHGNDDDKCDEDNPGNSHLCDDDFEPELDRDRDRINLSDDFKNFGQSTDRVELQKQLQLLLTLLIQLLQAQL